MIWAYFNKKGISSAIGNIFMCQSHHLIVSHRKYLNIKFYQEKNVGIKLSFNYA